MADRRSFRDVIDERYEDELFDAVHAYISENPTRLERTTRYVQSPDEAVLSRVFVRSVQVSNSPGASIKFDVVVEAEFEISETVRRDRETDSIEQWFRISCTAVLENGLNNFEIHDVVVYGKYGNASNTLSDALVPYIRPNQLDDLAEEFLKRYYPEALGAPMPVPPLEVARRMGLDVQIARLTKNCTVFGQLYFADCETEIYDEDTCMYKPLTVKRGSLLVDPDVFFMRTLGSVNNTIIHECVHWDKHRKVFELERLYNENAHRIKCQVVEGRQAESKRTSMEWMEWHANALAPRILMPRKQAYVKANELIAIHMQIQNANRVADVIEPVIVEMADFFGVSKLAAKIRMLDLGFEEAAGVLSYIDNQYVQSHSFAKGTLKRNQTFSIGSMDALFAYATNPDLRRMLDTGDYLYIDKHFCINDPKYIALNAADQPTLTDYALSHADECMLTFDVTLRVNERFGSQFYKECVLFRDAMSETIAETTYQHSDQNKSIDAKRQELKQFSTDTKRIANIQRQLPATMSATLLAHMERIGISEEVLAEKAQISTKTIQRIRTDKKVKLESMIAICVGLQLPSILSLDLIKKSGCAFMPGNTAHIGYQMILNTYYRSSIFECNEMLEAAGIKPLGGKSDE